MKVIQTVCAGVVLGTVLLGCDAVKAKEPKQASDPVVATPKYGDQKLSPMDPGEDAGAK